jgi:hypothetical protein
MKNLLPLLSIPVLITAALSLDSQPLDAGALFPALAVAALFAVALNDRPLRHRPPPEARPAKANAIGAEEWSEQKLCVFCAGPAS